MNSTKHIVQSVTSQLQESTKRCPGELRGNRIESFRSHWFQEWFDSEHQDPASLLVSEKSVQLVCNWFHHRPWGGLLVLAGFPADTLRSFANNLCRFVSLFSEEANIEGFWTSIPRSSYFSTRHLFSKGEGERPCVPGSVIDDSFVVLDHVGERPNLSSDELGQLNFILSRRCSCFTLVITQVPRSQWREAFDDSMIFKLEDRSAVIDLATCRAAESNNSVSRLRPGCAGCYHMKCHPSKPAPILTQADELMPTPDQIRPPSALDCYRGAMGNCSKLAT